MHFVGSNDAQIVLLCKKWYCYTSLFSKFTLEVCPSNGGEIFAFFTGEAWPRILNAGNIFYSMYIYIWHKTEHNFLSWSGAVKTFSVWLSRWVARNTAQTIAFAIGIFRVVYIYILIHASIEPSLAMCKLLCTNFHDGTYDDHSYPIFLVLTKSKGWLRVLAVEHHWITKVNWFWFS